MKKNTLTFILLLSVVLATAQTKTKSYPSNTVQKPATLQPAEKNIPVPKLPDLKITALSVSATPSHFDSIQKYNVNISFTVKNIGYASVLTDAVTLITYLASEDWITRANKDMRFTGFYSPAGGWKMGIPGKGETLEAGASKQESYTKSNVVLRQPNPLFMVEIRMDASVQELNAGNNLEYTSIIY